VTQLTRRNVLLLAVAMAAATTFVAYLFLTRQQVQALSGPATQTMVVLAREQVRPLEVLRPDQFTVKQMRADGVPRDAVATPGDLKGKVALVTMLPGQIVTERQIATKSSDLGLAYAVKPPLRAVTVALDPIIGVAGFPKPGNHVDVLATFTTDAAGTVTRTVLQDVEILALGSESQPKEVDPNTGQTSKAKETPTATLAVLPGEAEKLILAENRGKLRLALRGVDDKTYVARTMTKEVAVVGVAPQPKNAPISTVTRTAPAPSPAHDEHTVREEHSYQTTDVRPLPPPSLPGITALPAPKPEPPAHEITVIHGTEKQLVKFKKDRAGNHAVASDAREAAE
jgi:pilus assembly protein CpaB